MPVQEDPADRRRGALFALEHDLPKVRALLNDIFGEAAGQSQTVDGEVAPIGFIGGRTYAVGVAAQAFDDAVAALQRELDAHPSE